MSDATRGLYRKYDVRRTDGSSGPGGKHEECEYFVLDLDHDEHAVAALEAYAASCEATHPALSRDLRQRLPGLRMRASYLTSQRRSKDPKGGNAS